MNLEECIQQNPNTPVNVMWKTQTITNVNVVELAGDEITFKTLDTTFTAMWYEYVGGASIDVALSVVKIMKPDPIQTWNETKSRVKMIKTIRLGLNLKLEDAKKMVDGYLAENDLPTSDRQIAQDLKNLATVKAMHPDTNDKDLNRTVRSELDYIVDTRLYQILDSIVHK